MGRFKHFVKQVEVNSLVLRALAYESEAEVNEINFAVLYYHVARGQVPVDYAIVVQLRYRFADLFCYVPAISIQNVLDFLPVNKLKHEYIFLFSKHLRSENAGPSCLP